MHAVSSCLGHCRLYMEADWKPRSVSMTLPAARHGASKLTGTSEFGETWANSFFLDAVSATSPFSRIPLCCWTATTHSALFCLQFIQWSGSGSTTGQCTKPGPSGCESPGALLFAEGFSEGNWFPFSEMAIWSSSSMYGRQRIGKKAFFFFS